MNTLRAHAVRPNLDVSRFHVDSRTLASSDHREESHKNALKKKIPREKDSINKLRMTLKKSKIVSWPLLKRNPRAVADTNVRVFYENGVKTRIIKVYVYPCIYSPYIRETWMFKVCFKNT